MSHVFSTGRTDGGFKNHFDRRVLGLYYFLFSFFLLSITSCSWLLSVVFFFCFVLSFLVRMDSWCSGKDVGFILHVAFLFNVFFCHSKVSINW
ncbi:hypothetical protein BZA05DRAFT_399337 [Tricharina praecox]|uniref:uncharacterized protein n=1 Tax=Tricharina praecox TaxID=43433 RepID=UPI00221FD61F|nr:uncharacterized protein BZA05DRAFT_399337 [Tricharina praecox]KAI5850971.1 hypothetical protein BZA05DRAFT_399337 [Tricharina praecox]